MPSVQGSGENGSVQVKSCQCMLASCLKTLRTTNFSLIHPRLLSCCLLNASILLLSSLGGGELERPKGKKSATNDPLVAKQRDFHGAGVWQEEASYLNRVFWN